ncbi:MAG: hypothetical protein ACKE9I_02685 [Methylophagaceae bacterium]
MIQQDENQPYLRLKTEELVTLIQGFITKKMMTYQLALWELSKKVSTVLQHLKRTSPSLHIAPCPDLLNVALKPAFSNSLGII